MFLPSALKRKVHSLQNKNNKEAKSGNLVPTDIQAYIQFTNDTAYWQSHAFNQTFQNATTFFQLGGTDINVYGGGMLDGNGQIWYDLYASDIYILRPVLVGIIGLHSGSISNLRWRYSPQWYSLTANSTDVVFDNIDIAGYSQSNNTAKNTDGWDTYRSSNVVIQDSVINNGDDCVSFKPNSTEILVQNLHCNGSHGISVGSLGQYVGETDIVENVLVRTPSLPPSTIPPHPANPPSPQVTNTTMSNASDMARIKVWPGTPSALSGDLQGGGGTGRVSNITYTHLTITNVDYAIEITQCYGQPNYTLCTAYPSNLTISDIRIVDIHGTTSSKYEPVSGYVVCSSEEVCSGIEVQDVDVVAPDGTKNLFVCGNVDEGLLEGVTCEPVGEGD